MRKILKQGFVILEGTLHSEKAEGKITYRSKKMEDLACNNCINDLLLLCIHEWTHSGQG